jgi:hypothetical protein
VSCCYLVVRIVVLFMVVMIVIVRFVCCIVVSGLGLLRVLGRRFFDEA